VAPPNHAAAVIVWSLRFIAPYVHFRPCSLSSSIVRYVTTGLPEEVRFHLTAGFMLFQAVRHHITCHRPGFRLAAHASHAAQMLHQRARFTPVRLLLMWRQAIVFQIREATAPASPKQSSVSVYSARRARRAARYHQVKAQRVSPAVATPPFRRSLPKDARFSVRRCLFVAPCPARPPVRAVPARLSLVTVFQPQSNAKAGCHNVLPQHTKMFHQFCSFH